MYVKSIHSKKIDKIGFVIVQKRGRHSEAGVFNVVKILFRCNQNFRMLDEHYIRGKQTIQRKQVIHMGKIEFVGESNFNIVKHLNRRRKTEFNVVKLLIRV